VTRHGPSCSEQPRRTVAVLETRCTYVLGGRLSSVVESVSFAADGVLESLLQPPDSRVLPTRAEVLGRLDSGPLELRA
jgi:hypothetical protein